jgi:hypothetical protein
MGERESKDMAVAITANATKGNIGANSLQSI